jgi:23S rRNA pseudouridine2457 synthase
VAGAEFAIRGRARPTAAASSDAWRDRDAVRASGLPVLPRAPGPPSAPRGVYTAGVLIGFNKPYGVLCQFTDSSVPPRPTLAGFGLPEGIYAAGRLDFDSEGLLLLSDDGARIAQISSPKFKWPKTYLVQVEGTPDDAALNALRKGVELADGPTQPAQVQQLQSVPDWLWPRKPSVRHRKSVPDAFLEVTLREGRNRQVRRMTAAVGLPTLRLVRISIGPYRLDGLQPGAWREEKA